MAAAVSYPEPLERPAVLAREVRHLLRWIDQQRGPKFLEAGLGMARSTIDAAIGGDILPLSIGRAIIAFLRERLEP